MKTRAMQEFFWHNYMLGEMEGSHDSSQEQNAYQCLNLHSKPAVISKKSTRSTPFIVLTVLLCLIIILLLVVLGIDVHAGYMQDTSTSPAEAVRDLPALPTSCKEIKERVPSSPSGVYLLAKTSGVAMYTTYCNMDTLCGSGGGWTRLAYLDMSDAMEDCPPGFRMYQSGGVRACGRPPTNSGGCVSVLFPSNGISYSQVCGRVVGYQYHSHGAFDISIGSNHSNLNSYYVDGVSITRGSPRQHVWTLMAAYYYAHTINPFNCPCNTGSTVQVQSFIGEHYFCESGFPDQPHQASLYISGPLWDGQDCSSRETACCSVPGLPWFHRDYGSTTTTDYLELRVCADQGTIDGEDVPVSFYEIYVK